MVVTVRAESDPYIAVVEFTHYSMDFGNTQAENAEIGSTLLIVGGIVATIPLLVGICIYKCATNRSGVGGLGAGIVLQ